MAKVKHQSDLSGVFGESVSFRKVNGKVVAINRPKRKMGKPNEKQKSLRQRFREASIWADRQMLSESVQALYKKRVTDKLRSAHAVATADHLNPPQVQRIDTKEYRGRIGDVIVIKAYDDFLVTRVKVVITDTSGAIIEEGEATQSPDQVYLWDYATTVANPVLAGTTITATAYDKPRHTGELEVVL